MEIWDILDEHGNKTGKTKIRGNKLNHSEYHLVIHVWIKNSNGQYLVQKRAKDLKVMPDIWAITGGSAVSGEDSLTSAVREVQEELGIFIDSNEFKFINRVTRGHGLVDVWFVEKDINMESFKLQKEEVAKVAYKLPEEIIDMRDRKKFYDYGDAYFDIIWKYKS